ncbi:MAG: hypothetical protein ACE15F_01300 [bacterium]
MFRVKSFLYWLILFHSGFSLAARAENWDLTQTLVISTDGASPLEQRSARVLVEEVEKRTGIRWRIETSPPQENVPLIVTVTARSFQPLTRVITNPFANEPDFPMPEGYRIRLVHEGSRLVVYIVGNDGRGVLYGVGHLLRKLEMSPGRIAIEDNFQATTAPHYPLRGHQLGYRPKTNSYDGWTVPMWEQYIRELALSGANAIELIPPRSDDDADSPHFTRPPMAMMVEMSRIADEYGMDVWAWYPALDADYTDPRTVEAALREWGDVFRQLPRLDEVLVPGGDPGHTRPPVLFAFLEKVSAVLRQYHPQARIWISPQGFTREWMDEFYGLLRNDPAWLHGVVYGPQCRDELPVLRKAVPARYPIRFYPDITHSRHCQFPVPDWDLAYAMAEGREVINPRPRDEAVIIRRLMPYTIGAITYSEGCNDDVNKFIWSRLSWDPDADVVEILRDYGRFFIGASHADAFAQGLLALENNWRGPLLSNSGVDIALHQFQSMEKSASPKVLLNWRFQMALYRAYYDAYLRSRLIYETSLEEQALEALRQAGRVGSVAAMDQAEAILARALLEPAARDRRARIFELAEALFQSARMQLSETKYRAIETERGANLDTIDVPLNNTPWLKIQFAEIRKLGPEEERLARIGEILNWTNPGPGGYYDDLGNPSQQPHLVRGMGFEQDPALFHTPFASFAYRSGKEITWRLSWLRHIDAFFDGAVTLRYTDLDPAAAYQVRVVHAGEERTFPIRLTADGGREIHPYWQREEAAPRPLEFDIPRDLTEDGVLELQWQKIPGAGGNGRGCAISEVWLMRKKP